MSTLAVAIAGITHWHAPRYLEALAANDTRVLGVSDADPGAAETAAAALGCRGFADTADMLAAVKPDFVLALPRHDRALAEARAIADRRLPVLIEKPMGANALEARQVADLLDAGKFAAVCLPNRHLEFWEAIAALRESGRLGTVAHASFRVVNGPPARYPAYGVPWMLEPAKSGGGVLRNLGSHGADAALALGGPDLAVRGAVVSRRAHGLAIEDYAHATLANPDGFCATLEVGYTHAADASDQEWRLAAAGAYIRDANGTLAVTTADGRVDQRPCRRAAEAYRLLVDEALARFRRGRQPVADVHACASAVALLDAIYATAGHRIEA